MDLSNIRREDWGWFAAAEHYAGQSQWEHDPRASCNRPVLGDLNIESSALLQISVNPRESNIYLKYIYLCPLVCPTQVPFLSRRINCTAILPSSPLLLMIAMLRMRMTFFVLLTGWGELIAGVSCTDLELPALAPQLLDAVASLPLFRSITFVAVISP